MNATTQSTTPSAPSEAPHRSHSLNIAATPSETADGVVYRADAFTSDRRKQALALPFDTVHPKRQNRAPASDTNYAALAPALV